MAAPLDVIIIGGGPAGLSAALVLGRCRRRVVVCDSGRPRNQVSDALHGYLTRDGVEPAEFLRLARAELVTYGVEFRSGLVADAGRNESGEFWARMEDGERLESRRMLLATGVRDCLPRIDGLDALYGRGVFHCPYCDGWERRDRCLAAYGKGSAAVGLALSLRTWSREVIACTDGVPVDDTDRQRADRNGIRIREERLIRLEERDGELERLIFEHGPPERCDALFFNTGQVQRSGLADTLNCRFKENGGILASDRQCTDVRGLYVAGDAEKEVQFVIVAAAEGAVAGVAINRELQDEDRGEGTAFAERAVAQPPE